MYLKLSKTHHTGHLYRIVGQKLHSCLYSSTQGIVSTRGVDILPWMHDFRYLKIICIFLKIICRFFAFQSKKFMVAWFLWWLDAHTSSIYTVLTVCTWNNQIHHLHENTVQTLAVMLHGNNRTDFLHCTNIEHYRLLMQNSHIKNALSDICGSSRPKLCKKNTAAKTQDIPSLIDEA